MGPPVPSPKYLSPITGCSSRVFITSAVSSRVSAMSIAARFSAVRFACLCITSISEVEARISEGTTVLKKVTYEEPGNGITCGPREETQAMQN